MEKHSIARRIAIGCLLPAALTPRQEWHEHYKHLTAGAGAIAALSCDGTIDPLYAEDLLIRVEVEFQAFCDRLKEDLGPEHVDAARLLEWRRINDQRGELFLALRKRVAERMSLLQAEAPEGGAVTVEAVSAMLGAIAERRGKR